MKSCFLLLFIIAIASCKTIHTPIYQLDYTDDKESKVRIVQISDFHSNDFGKNEKVLIEKIIKAKPDLIFLTGDTFDFKQKKLKPVENVKFLLNGIKDLCPIFYITGNHEYYLYHNDEFNYLIEEAGGKVLNNKALIEEVKEKEFIIAGINDPFADLSEKERLKDKDDKEAYIKRIFSLWEECEKLSLKNKEAFKILLAHRPEYFEIYKKTGFDLILSGHAHGGQWRMFGINGIYAPMQGLFPKYAGGKYTCRDKNGRKVMIVSRGLSYQQPKLPRIFNNPELVIIDLVFTAETSDIQH